MRRKQVNKDCILGRLAILTTAIIWGTSFVVLKETLNEIPTHYVLAYRFSGAAVLMLLLGLKKLEKIDRAYVKGGVIMGILLYFAYTIQTYGLYYTTPSKNAFLTTSYCVLVPFIYWVLTKRKPSIYNFIAAAICLAGVGFVTLHNDKGVNIGDVLTVCSGLFYALHIIATSKHVKGRSVVALTLIQFATAGVLSWISALLTDPIPTGVSAGSKWSIVYLCVMCTAGCYVLQTYGQKHTPPSTVAVIMTLEAVFGALISVFFYDEVLTPKLLLGFLMIFIAVIISETELGFLRRKRPVDKIIMEPVDT